MSQVNFKLDVCDIFEWKGNLNDSTVCNTGETGDKQTTVDIVKLPLPFGTIN